jgi:hypothetical protein
VIVMDQWRRHAVLRPISLANVPPEVEGALSLMCRHFASIRWAGMHSKHAIKAQKHAERARRYLAGRGIQ